jgi:hypothetical protein
VSDAERLSRYVFEANKFDLTKNEPKFRAFLPPREDCDLSVMRTEGLSETQVWRLGDDYAGRGRPRPALARGDFAASALAPLELSAIPDPPPPEHASVTGWPAELSEEMKQKRKDIAMKLAAVAKGVARPA